MKSLYNNVDGEYIEFSCLMRKVERNVMMNKDDENEVYVWKDKVERKHIEKTLLERCAIGDRGWILYHITSKHPTNYIVCAITLTTPSGTSTILRAIIPLTILTETN